MSKGRRATKHPSIAASRTMAWVRHIFAARPVESCSLRNSWAQPFVLEWKMTGNSGAGSVRRIA
jgi:hypothetical protein